MHSLHFTCEDTEPRGGEELCPTVRLEDMKWTRLLLPIPGLLPLQVSLPSAGTKKLRSEVLHLKVLVSRVPSLAQFPLVRGKERRERDKGKR